jgi:hypothetical protein
LDSFLPQLLSTGLAEALPLELGPFFARSPIEKSRSPSPSPSSSLSPSPSLPPSPALSKDTANDGEDGNSLLLIGRVDIASDLRDAVWSAALDALTPEGQLAREALEKVGVSLSLARIQVIVVFRPHQHRQPL